MTNFIPVFPLGIVVYPGEVLNLHIFEARYKQLINDCYGEKKSFGIPIALGDKLQEYGTLVEVIEIKEIYEDGKMDIRIQGISVFRLLEMVEKLPDKMYSGGIVSYPENIENATVNIMEQILESIKELHKLLHIEKSFPKPVEAMVSYDVAHHAGFTLEQELELLKLTKENQRQEYLRRHLLQVIPIVKEMETLKERVKLNGHFRELKSWGL